jgi:hypothetical protein
LKGAAIEREKNKSMEVDVKQQLNNIHEIESKMRLHKDVSYAQTVSTPS